jgi:hypothetical protein
MADLFDKEEMGVVGSLFGVTPESLQLSRERVAGQQGFNAGNNLLGGILQQTGTYAERGAAGLRSALGTQLPEEKLAALRQQAKQLFDATNPEDLVKAAQFLNANGDAEGARYAMMLQQSQLQKLATLDKTKEEIKLRSAQTQQAEAGKIIQVDLGDKIQLVNALTKEVIREIPKGMTAAQSAKQEAAATVQKEAASNILDSAVEGKTLVSNLEKQVGYNTVGIGSALSWIPMTEAKKFNADLATLKSQLTLAAMNAAKSQSKTGATGFGALNSKELKVLQDNISSLDTELSPDDFKTKLGEVTSYFDKLEKKATGTLNPAGSNIPDIGEFADDYKKYKEKYGPQAMPYNAYVQKRKG